MAANMSKIKHTNNSNKSTKNTSSKQFCIDFGSSGNQFGKNPTRFFSERFQFFLRWSSFKGATESTKKINESFNFIFLIY